ncbi:formyltetrahydrofolate deformylase [bacterium]|mgnify:FL=1|jgi:formyltetrahydrofolate deformylase|nr:formyltetrahydrofolate deformylase [bacterium]
MTKFSQAKKGVFLIHCPDKKGIIASVTDYILSKKWNITCLQQNVDSEDSIFSMRIEWEYSDENLSEDDLTQEFNNKIGKKYNMYFLCFLNETAVSTALFVSKDSHCLLDLLSRWKYKELPINIKLIIGNHEEMKTYADMFSVPFYYIPISSKTKPAVEKKQLELLKKYNINLIVLARYMQILSPAFISNYRYKIINVHHSFLPAFPGAKPYHHAYQRGVKLIGSTSHYVTPELDAGPIISQHVTNVSHRESIQDFVRMGRELEKNVLANAVWNHANRKTLVIKNRVVVFD